MRIKYKKVRADTDEEVSPENIVKGYQYEKDRYVVLTDDEIEHMKTPKDKAISILHFTAKDSIDPIFFEKCYYAVPDGSDKAFSLLREAMVKQNAVAIAKTVIGTKETLMALSAIDDGIVAETLHYQNEIKAIPKPYMRAQISDAELSMAEQLIQSMIRKFQPELYHDEYKARVREAIQRKIQGQEIVAAQPQAVGNNVIDLMDALQRSLAQTPFVPPPQQPIFPKIH